MGHTVTHVPATRPSTKSQTRPCPCPIGWHWPACFGGTNSDLINKVSQLWVLSHTLNIVQLYLVLLNEIFISKSLPFCGYGSSLLLSCQPFSLCVPRVLDNVKEKMDPSTMKKGATHKSWPSTATVASMPPKSPRSPCSPAKTAELWDGYEKLAVEKAKERDGSTHRRSEQNYGSPSRTRLNSKCKRRHTATPSTTMSPMLEELSSQSVTLLMRTHSFMHAK